MRSEEQIRTLLEETKTILTKLGEPCSCGCQTDTFDYYKNRIKLLEEILDDQDEPDE